MFTSITSFISQIFLVVNSQTTAYLVIALFILLIITFIISGAEVALFSLNEKDVNMLKTKQHAAAKRIVNLLEEPKEVYASLLISGTLVNICIIVLSNYLLTTFISWEKVGGFLEFLIKGTVIAFALVFFGRIFPKVWASQNSLRFAYGSVVVVESLHLLLRRITKWVVKLADNIGRGAGAHKTEAINMRELDAAIEIQPDEESTREEKDIMKGIVKFSNINVKQIMRSRLDVSGLDHKLNFQQVIKRVEDLHYSRLPVFKDDLDNVVGLINTKDLLPFLDEPDNYDWHGLMRQPYFVPETKLIEDLLREFQQKRIHFAVVVDEFGGTSGIVTMEDIMEEVIGEIKDEFDDEELISYKVDNNNYLFDGKTMIHDMCKKMRLPTDTFDQVRGESESLAGLILELAGEFPAKDAVVGCGDFIFTIIQADNNRIQQVQVTINPPKGKDDEE
jgi:putative hemolysin